MNEIQIIQNFIAQYSDFGSYSNEQYKAVYRPSWHPEPVSFWFNPPFDSKGVSRPSVSGILCLAQDGTVYVENYNTGEFFDLSKCMGGTMENAIYAIQLNNQA